MVATQRQDVNMGNVSELQKRALTIANYYDDYNRAKGRKTWGIPDYVDGMVGDVGDLVKAVMGTLNRRDIAESNAKVEHELNDIMWSLLILYKCFQIDPDVSFAQAMDDLEMRIKNMKQSLNGEIK